jgi:hypothetical protein
LAASDNNQIKISTTIFIKVVGVAPHFSFLEVVLDLLCEVPVLVRPEEKHAGDGRDCAQLDRYKKHAGYVFIISSSPRRKTLQEPSILGYT